jgi:hypothetical protein
MVSARKGPVHGRFETLRCATVEPTERQLAASLTRRSVGCRDELDAENRLAGLASHESSRAIAS